MPWCVTQDLQISLQPVQTLVSICKLCIVVILKQCLISSEGTNIFVDGFSLTADLSHHQAAAIRKLEMRELNWMVK